MISTQRRWARLAFLRLLYTFRSDTDVKNPAIICTDLLYLGIGKCNDEASIRSTERKLGVDLLSKALDASFAYFKILHAEISRL